MLLQEYLRSEYSGQTISRLSVVSITKIVKELVNIVILTIQISKVNFSQVFVPVFF